MVESYSSSFVLDNLPNNLAAPGLHPRPAGYPIPLHTHLDLHLIPDS